jgi:hypothetical protein
LSHFASPFLCWVFSRKGHVNYFPGLALKVTILISTFWVARITGMNHWHLRHKMFLKLISKLS